MATTGEKISISLIDYGSTSVNALVLPIKLYDSAMTPAGSGNYYGVATFLLVIAMMVVAKPHVPGSAWN